MPSLFRALFDIVLICSRGILGRVRACSRSEACSVRAGAREALFERGGSNEGAYQSSVALRQRSLY